VDSTYDFFFRLASMDNPNPPITICNDKDRASIRLERLKQGLSQEDQKIVERLSNLIQSRSAVETKKRDPPEVEIAKRLAKLKGIIHGFESRNNVLILMFNQDNNHTIR